MPARGPKATFDLAAAIVSIIVALLDLVAETGADHIALESAEKVNRVRQRSVAGGRDEPCTTGGLSSESSALPVRFGDLEGRTSASTWRKNNVQRSTDQRESALPDPMTLGVKQRIVLHRRKRIAKLAHPLQCARSGPA